MPDARSVHQSLKALKVLGNEVRLRFAETLRLLHDNNLFFELGYASYVQYCDLELGLARSTAFVYLRAATALEGLPVLRALCARGELSWQQVCEISRVATAETEAAWIRFAIEETVANLLVEVQDAVRTGRNAPRDKRSGLPNLLVKVSFEMTLEEKERVRAAFAITSEALGGVDDADPRPVLVRWADAVLSGAIAGPLPPRAGADRGTNGEEPLRTTAPHRPTPAQTVLYRTCPECRTSVVETAEGPVEVSAQRVVELAPLSTRVVISPHEEFETESFAGAEHRDQPNGSRLARQVLTRDGLRCTNPGCGRRRNLQAHHIVFRAHGGRTALSNEVAVCDTCHALLHKGLLEVSGSPDGGLSWTRRPLNGAARVGTASAIAAMAEELTQASERRESNYVDSVAAQRLRPPHDVQLAKAAIPVSPNPSPVPVPRSRADADLSRRLRVLEEGLVGLNFTPEEAELRIRDAYTSLTAEAGARSGMPPDVTLPTDDEIFTLALYGQVKATAVWEFHAKRRRGRGTQSVGGVAEQSQSKCVDSGDSAAWSDSNRLASRAGRP